MQHFGPVAWNWCTGATHQHTSGKVSYAKVQFHTHAHICPSMLTCLRKIIPHLLFFPNSALFLISVCSLHQLLPYSPNNICKLRCSCLPQRLHFRSGLTLVLHMYWKKIDSPTSLTFSPPPPHHTHSHHTHSHSSYHSISKHLHRSPAPLRKTMLTRSALCWKDSEVPCNLFLEELLSTAQSPVLGFPHRKTH